MGRLPWCGKSSKDPVWMMNGAGQTGYRIFAIICIKMGGRDLYEKTGQRNCKIVDLACKYCTGLERDGQYSS
jgi:hypothetical protein